MTALRFKFCIFILCIIMFVAIYGLHKFWCDDHKNSNQETTKQEITVKEIKKEPKIVIETNDFKVSEVASTNKSTEAITKPPELISLGNFKLTAYCPCSLCCGKWANNRPNGIVYGAIGEKLKEGYSVAVDPKVIPYRTEVVINGHTYKAQDCGGGIKGNEIDIYMSSHQRALNFGVQYAEVFVKM